MNLYDLFLETVRQQPDHPAILGPKSQEVLRYRELNDAIVAASARTFTRVSLYS